jgi:hypothetical protein
MRGKIAFDPHIIYIVKNNPAHIVICAPGCFSLQFWLRL